MAPGAGPIHWQGPAPASLHLTPSRTSATPSEHGAELWATDGTAAGTGIVEDICPGFCSSVSYDAQVQAWPGGVLLVGIDDGVYGREIWFSDGTPAGTRRITDFAAYGSSESAYFSPLVSFEDKVWFASGQHFGEGGLWVTDGTPSSTRMLAHLGRSEPTSEPRYLTAAAGRLYFAAFDGAVRGVWSTLGPPESTVLVKAGASLTSDSSMIEGIAAGGLVFFWSPAGSTSWPTTVCTAPSCGPATAPPRAP